MVRTPYSEAATEVLAILNNTDKEAVNKIPKKFIEFLKENSCKTYKPDFCKDKTIKELNLKPKTQALLGLIYLKCWANEQQRAEFTKRAIENEKVYQQELTEKYSTDNLFKNIETSKPENDMKAQKTSLITIKENNFVQRIINKIKSIFRR